MGRTVRLCRSLLPAVLSGCAADSDARCGDANERDCIPVDDWSGTQAFICGGEVRP